LVCFQEFGVCNQGEGISLVPAMALFRQVIRTTLGMAYRVDMNGA